MDIKKLQVIHNNDGDIFVFEGTRFDFPIQRVYFTKNVAVGSIRGHHAHKTLEQILICPHGAIKVISDDGRGNKTSTVLDNPQDGLYIGPSTWRTMQWLKPESILLVLASKPYEESDYIRNYEEFCRHVAKSLKRSVSREGP